MSKLQTSLNSLLEKSYKDKTVYKPDFFNLSHEKDRHAFEALLKQPDLRIADELHGQLRELIKSQHPKHKFTSEELDAEAKKYCGDTPPEEYGVWVYYPWLNKLVHILDEQEYKAVRTNRNQFKIMPEEREILAKKKIGVLGLSVGQSVAIALSMERSYGELRIADFDILELSNLNRIRSGVQDLGLLKTISTARQIAEIDPFLNVKCFHEGITEENIESFFLDGGKLDIVLDECDGLDIKILARKKAKELKVPVIMETSDRGMLDI
ncbi:MAG: ThiF family adenylyltransferase, partial [Chitinophagales bacterium]